MITLKTQTRHTNKSSGGEFADVRCRGFAVRSRLIFLSKAVLHFDYLVFLKAIQVGLFALVCFPGIRAFQKGPRPIIYAHI